MYLKRVFCFLAIAFLLVDVLLFAMYMQTRNNQLVLSDRMIEDTVAYYNSNGVEIDKKTIQARMPENPIFTFSGTNYSIAEKVADKIADKMLSSAVVSFVETPDGMVYSFSEQDKSIAVFKVFGDGCEFEYSLSGYEIKNEQVPFIEFNLDDKQIPEIQSDIKKQISSFVSCISENSDCKYTVLGSLRQGNGVYVYIARNVYGTYLLDDMSAVFYFEENKLKSVIGSWIFPEIKKSYFEPLYDGLNALKKLDKSQLKRIISEEIVYSYRNTGDDTGYVIPVWKIEYIDVKGSRNIQYIDAIKD